MMKPSGLERECGLDIPDKRSHRTKTPRGSQGPKRFSVSLALSAPSRERTCVQVFEDAKVGMDLVGMDLS